MNVRNIRGIHAFGLLLASLALSACSVSFTTAHISELKLFNDEAKQHTVSGFQLHDTIYARAVVANAVEKITLKFQLITVDVAGQAKNAALAALDTAVELPGDGEGTYTLTPPEAGWPLGKYRVEAGMFVEGGTRKDFKTIDFEVSGD